MTDVEMERLSAICAVANVNDIEDLSDGFHTFNDLYEQRMWLFAALVNAYKDKAWKSLRHEDGEHCFGGDLFIVGIDTPEGSYTYHYGIQYWDVFDCQILPRAKHWDGHTDKDVTRLMSLQSEQRWIPCYERMPKEKDAGILKKLGTEKRSEYVLATVEVKGERMTVTACTYDGKWDWNMKYAFPDFKVVAWMPSPEPWRGESE